MDIMDILGFTAAFLTTFSFFPQAYKTIRTKDTAGISLWMYCVFTLGVLIWFVYGIMRNDLPVAIANMITLIPAAVILGIKLRNASK